jgi:hypothetical protein
MQSHAQPAHSGKLTCQGLRDNDKLRVNWCHINLNNGWSKPTLPSAKYFEKLCHGYDAGRLNNTLNGPVDKDEDGKDCDAYAYSTACGAPASALSIFSQSIMPKTGAEWDAFPCYCAALTQCKESS